MSDFKAGFRRLAIPLCALLLLVVAVFYPTPEKPRRLKVALGLWPGSETLLVAIDQKLLPADTYQLIELPWSSMVMRVLGSGAVDVAVMTLDSVLRMREAGQKARVVMVLDQSVGADAVVTGPQFPNMQALKGKKVGVNIRGTGSYLLVNALESAGMTMADIQVVPMIQPEMESAVQGGVVDAAVVAEPWLSRLQRAGYRSVYDSKQLSIPILRVLVVSEQAKSATASTLKPLLKAQVAMTKKLRSDLSPSDLQSILRREQLKAEEFMSCLERLKPMDRNANAEMLSGEKPRLEEMATAMVQQMKRNGLLKATPDTTGWIDATLFEEAFR